jgi:hypothetical protein
MFPKSMAGFLITRLRGWYKSLYRSRRGPLCKKMMAKKRFIRDLSGCDSPTDELQPIFFQFIQAFAFNHDVPS